LGAGGYVSRLFPRPCGTFGIDYSLSSLNLARQSLPHVPGLTKATAYALPFGDQVFDLVTCIEVLEHLADDGKAVAEISRVLRPNGLLIVSVPNYFYFPQYLELMGHYRHYSAESLSALLSRHGLAVSESLNQYRRFNFAHFYVHAGLTGLNLALNRLTGRSTSMYARRAPFLGGSLYRRIVSPLLWPLKKMDELRGTRAGSTFLVARPVAGGGHPLKVREQPE
jgi:SAM-dependent methyltransferase